MDIENEKRIPFRSGDDVEDVLSYARKMNALGDVIVALSWAEKTKNICGEDLLRVADEIGYIIQDYAQAIEIMTHNFVEYDDHVESPLGRAQEVYEFVNKFQRPEDLPAINFQIKELNEFFEKYAMPVVRLTNNFKDLIEDIMHKQRTAPKPAPATESGAQAAAGVAAGG